MKPEARGTVSLLFAPVIGFLCFLLPILILGNVEVLDMPGSSTNVVSRVFENMSFVPTAILLVLAGFGLRYVAGRGTWAFPFLLIAAFPVATCVDLLMNPASHNLLPIECAIQLAFVVPALVGAYAASVLGKEKRQT